MEPLLEVLVAALASFIFITIIFGIFFCFCGKYTASYPYQQQQRRQQQPQQLPHRIQINHNVHDRRVLDESESATFDPNLDRISMPDLIKATNNFASKGIIGDGSFGFVYKAQLSNGVNVAVKKLSHDAFQGLREFRAEMDTLGKIEHKNLVKMKGYCISGDDRLLIYEFIPHGSLDQWLHDMSLRSSVSSFNSLSSSASSNHCLRLFPLSWPQRVKIIKGVANGLSYLHDECNPRIIHRDIKASNVLLDLDFEAHIADFGLARIVDSSHSHVSTQVAGTMGYMPPEYKEGITVATVKADVYSFGILMLEVATGKRPNLHVKVENREMMLIFWARLMVQEHRFMDMIDPNIAPSHAYYDHDQGEEKEEGFGSIEEEVKEFCSIACLCTAENPRDRPNMSEVVSLLSRLHSF